MGKQFTLAELAEYTGSRLVGNSKHVVLQVADLESATETDVSFLSNSRYERVMADSKAGVIFVHPSLELTQERNYLVCQDPSWAFQKTVEAFYGQRNNQSGFEGIHPSAVIHPSAQIGRNVCIGPHVVIDRDVVIGDHTTIGANTSIGFEVRVGSECCIYSNVTVRERSEIGNRVVLQSGAVIGSCGFGFLTDKQGKHVKLQQVGNVVIEDDVEIGANTTIDRARFGSTRIKRGTKIDNLVQIAHGVSIGEDNLIVAQTGIAGSSRTGKHVVMAAQCGMAGHLKVVDGVILAARAGVTKSILQPGQYGGVPATPIVQYNRTSVLLRNIEKFVKQVKDLQKA